jgi:uncharacterized membrane protein YgcG
MAHGGRLWQSSRAVPAALLWLLALVTLLGIAASAAAAATPRFPDRPAGTSLVDAAGVFNRAAQTAFDSSLQSLASATGVDIVVYTQVKASARTPEDARADAQTLLDQWQVGGADGNGAVMLWDFDKAKSAAQVSLVGGAALLERVDQATLDGIVSDQMTGPLATADWLTALSQGLFALTSSISGSAPSTPAPDVTPPPPDITPAPGASATPAPSNALAPTPTPTRPGIGPAPAAGPPYPPPIDGVHVYDYAGVLSPAAIASVERTIAAIRERTGAQIAVYSQIKPQSDTPATAEADARALMDQWGVGRKGFNDGLVILFDLQENRQHGQVQLYAGPGYAATYLSNGERLQIYQDHMLPFLRGADFDGALIAAMSQIDAAATPEHAQNLQLARQIDAATGLVMAPLVLLLLVAWAGWSWLRYGKDPEYLDDPSVLMPAPPAGLTPAAAAVLLDGHATRHALTTAMVDLASRGEIRFRQEEGGFGHTKLDVEILKPDENDPRLLRNRRVPLGEPEAFALQQLQAITSVRGVIDSEDLLTFGKHVAAFDTRLEKVVADKGWFREPPEKSIERWSFRGAIVLVLGIIALIVAWNLPSSGLLLLGGAVTAAGIIILIIARVMPQRTMQGAMVYAWLAAYRRTLQKSLATARSMDDVVAAHVLPWLETPDQAVVWGYALGLHHEVEDVLERSVTAAREGTSRSGMYLPLWYVSAGGGPGSGPSGGPGGLAPGFFSSSAIPDFGAMTAALSTIGNSPSSSGSGSGGGGFGGGGSGGGGGGAGGGF